jgi:hypothetical protein
MVSPELIEKILKATKEAESRPLPRDTKLWGSFTVNGETFTLSGETLDEFEARIKIEMDEELAR